MTSYSVPSLTPLTLCDIATSPLLGRSDDDAHRRAFDGDEGVWFCLAKNVVKREVPNRSTDTHQRNFAAHTNHANSNFQQMLDGFKSAFMSQGFDPATATAKALAQAYQVIQAQASALSFESSFWIMSAIVFCLVPLPFIMRRPKAGEQRAGAAH